MLPSLASASVSMSLSLSAIGCLLASLTAACPESEGWYRSRITNLCYRCLRNERLNFFDAQKRCNSLRSNLLQFRPGDTKAVFDDLQQELADARNTTEFREASWIGLTDRAAVEVYAYLNGLPLNSIAPDTLISCPNENPNCKRAYRCVYLNLGNRGISNRQVFNGHCDSTMLPPICYAPAGGTDAFERVPDLGAKLGARGLVGLIVAGLVARASMLLSC